MNELVPARFNVESPLTADVRGADATPGNRGRDEGGQAVPVAGGEGRPHVRLAFFHGTWASAQDRPDDICHAAQMLRLNRDRGVLEESQGFSKEVMGKTFPDPVKLRHDALEGPFGLLVSHSEGFHIEYRPVHQRGGGNALEGRQGTSYLRQFPLRGYTPRVPSRDHVEVTGLGKNRRARILELVSYSARSHLPPPTCGAHIWDIRCLGGVKRRQGGVRADLQCVLGVISEGNGGGREVIGRALT
jgi:hypothetical protein